MSIILDKVNYIYGEGSGFVKHALKDVSLAVDKNEFIGLIGHTGSGKSTLTQIFNGLLRATSGDVYFNGDNIYDKDYDMKNSEARLALFFSIRNTSFLRQRFSRMYVSDRRISDSIRENVNFVHLRHLNLSEWTRSFSIIRLLNCRAVRKEERQLRALSQ